MNTNIDTEANATAFFSIFNSLERDLDADFSAQVKELEGQLKGKAWASYKVSEDFLKQVEKGISNVDAAKYSQRIAEAIDAAKIVIADIEAIRAQIAKLEAERPSLRASDDEPEAKPGAKQDPARYSAKKATDVRPPRRSNGGSSHGEVDLTGLSPEEAWAKVQARQ